MKNLDKNKLILPIAIILGCLILGGAFYKIQVNKQKSIEKQQQIELQAKTEADKAKTEQDKRDYIAKKKTDCLAIYKTESDKWNNTTGYEYVAEDDICYVSYKASHGEWKGEVCGDIGKDWDYKFWGYDSLFTRQMLRDSINCSNGDFEKQF